MLENNNVKIFLIFCPSFFKNGARNKNGFFFPVEERQRCLIGNFAYEGDYIIEPISTKSGKHLVEFKVEKILEEESNIFMTLTFKPNGGFNEKDIYNYFLKNPSKWFPLTDLEDYLAGKIHPKLSKRDIRRQRALLKEIMMEQFV